MTQRNAIARLEKIGFMNHHGGGVEATYTDDAKGGPKFAIGRSVRMTHPKYQKGDKYEGIYVHPDEPHLVITAAWGGYEALAQSITRSGIVTANRGKQEAVPAWAKLDDRDAVEELVTYLESVHRHEIGIS